jgi:hypothetical protein
MHSVAPREGDLRSGQWQFLPPHCSSHRSEAGGAREGAGKIGGCSVSGNSRAGFCCFELSCVGMAFGFVRAMIFIDPRPEGLILLIATIAVGRAAIGAWFAKPVAGAIALVGLSLLYALSAGPAINLQMRGIITIRKTNALGFFYYPLNLAERKCRYFGGLMYVYGQRWYHDSAPASSVQATPNAS